MSGRDELKMIYKPGAGLDAGSPLNNPEYQALVKDIESGDRGMKITCPHCGAQSFVRSSKPLSKLVKEARCQCGNLACGHTFIANVEVVRTISPPAFPDLLVAEELKQSKRGKDLYREVKPVEAAMT